MRALYDRLPPEIAAKLAAADRRAEAVAITSLLLTFVALSVAVFAPFALLDRVMDTPDALRWLFACVGAGLLSTALITYGCGLWRRSRQPLHTVRLVQSYHRSLGDSLQGAVELCVTPELAENVSPELVRAAVGQVVERTRGMEFSRAVKTTRLKQLSGYGMAAIGLLAAGLILNANVMGNAFSRLVLPWADVPRYTFTKFGDLPTTQYVLMGETATVCVELAPDSEHRPAVLSYALGDGVRQTGRLLQGRADIALPGVAERATLKLAAGDARTNVEIVPVPRPALTGLTANVQPPAYLNGVSERIDCFSQALNVVEGSRVALTGKTLSPLAHVLLKRPGNDLPASISGDSFSVPAQNAAHLKGSALNWTDTFGFQPKQPYALPLTIRPDAEPHITFPGMPQALAVLEDEVLELTVHAEDDFGLRQVGVSWDVQLEGEEAPSAKDRRVLAELENDTLANDSAFVFSASRLGLRAGARVYLRGWARDGKPGREAAMSAAHQIFVLSREQHAQLLMRELDKIRSALEDTLMTEKQLMDANAQLSELTQAELDAERADLQLAEQRQSENGNLERLQDLAEQTTELLSQALRNAQFPEDELRKWTEMLDALREAVDSDLVEASQALAMAQAGQGQERREQLERAIAAQKRALEKLRQLGGEMDDALMSIAVQTLADRFDAIGQTEARLSTALAATAARSVGMSAAELPKVLLAEITAGAERQSQAATAAARLIPDLRQSYLATGKDAYDDVRKEMEEKDIVGTLEALVNQIRENRLGMVRADLGAASKSFAAWAQVLRGEEENGGGGGEGGGEMPAEMMEFLLGLLRVAEKEQALRLDTGALHGERDRKGYEDRADQLAKRQKQLTGDLVKLKQVLEREDVAKFVARGSDLMDVVRAHLGKPDTGTPAQSAESAVIEFLMSVFNSSSSNSQGQSSQSLAMLAQKTMVMGMAAGSSGGGSNAGGGSGDPAGHAGSPGAEDGLGRRTQAGFAVDPATYPPEFRDLLHVYFKRLEAREETRGRTE